MKVEALLAAKLAAPITHEVLTVYSDGRERRFGVRGPREAENHAIGERRKIGRDLIDRETDMPVRLVSVEIKPCAINTRADAEAFIRELFARNLMFHFEDDAVECLHGNGLCTHHEAEVIGKQIEACYRVWNGADRDDCPIGYALEVMGE